MGIPIKRKRLEDEIDEAELRWEHICPMCRGEIRVPIGKKPPSIRANPRNLYFCSEECRAEFLKRRVEG